MAFDSIREKHFPAQLEGGYRVVACTEAEMNAFVSAHFDALFRDTQDGRFFRPTGERREQLRAFAKAYRVLHHEWFLFLDADQKPVGWSFGEADDAFTFYMRNTAVLPLHQRRGIYRAFLNRFSLYLADCGYERISSHHKPTNRRVLIAKLHAGYDIAGMELHESWGTLVKLVKLLREDRRRSFNAVFGDLNHL